MRNVYKMHEINKDNFYQVPKELFKNDYYKDLSSNAKLLYSILLDRKNLSKKNNWVNEKGEIYLIFTRDDARELLSISSKTTITKVFNELKEKELLFEERQGLNKPNIIYIGKINYKKGKDADKSRKYRKCTSGSTESVLQEVQTMYSNNTDISNKTEEEERKNSQKLSTNLKNRYQLLFNRTLSKELEKEILSTYNDEKIIEYCISLAEKNADKPSWIFQTLKDWKKRKLTTISEIEIYQEERKGKKDSKVNNKGKDISDRKKRKHFMQHLYR